MSHFWRANRFLASLMQSEIAVVVAAIVQANMAVIKLCSIPEVVIKPPANWDPVQTRRHA